MRRAFYVLVLGCLASTPLGAAESWPPPIEPLLRSVDLNVGESCKVMLADGNEAIVRLVDVHETRDNLRQAVRRADVTVEVNGRRATLTAGNYRLPIAIGGVQIDCAVTQSCVQPEVDPSEVNPWALEKAARLRLWPAGSAWIQPGTFMYPVSQRWFASGTQMANEPAFIDHFENPAEKSIYYHWGLDIGGAEGLAEVVAATDAVVITAELESISPPNYPPYVQPAHSEVFLRDGRGWYYRYVHMISIDPAIKPGAHVKMGQKIGVLGKEGGAGWSHLHFDILAPQPSGKFGILEGYAFLWQAYHHQSPRQLQAVARPHHVAWTGESVLLDGSRSWSAKGPQHIAAYQWLLSDGAKFDGPTGTHRYERSGTYTETLKVTDADGHIDYDFCVVQVADREHPELLPPTIHAAYWPTFDLKAGDEVTFKVYTFGLNRTEGRERWDFGDGSPAGEVQSDGQDLADAKHSYAVIKHRYTKPGDYVVSVARTNARGQTATARLYVRVE